MRNFGPFFGSLKSTCAYQLCQTQVTEDFRSIIFLQQIVCNYPVIAAVRKLLRMLLTSLDKSEQIQSHIPHSNQRVSG